jgi:hypothetical protein
VELSFGEVEARYEAILRRCTPFIISYPANWPALDLNPFGLEISAERRFTATSLASRDVVDGLHHLDAVTFGDQEMLMPRWVLFDCGEFPGLVFGFGCRSDQLPDYAREAYHVLERDDAYVPLSMWVAVRCAEDDAWFGHNLSSGNLILKGADALPGLAVITKIIGVKVTRANKQYGATQWDSDSIGLHLRLGDMEVLSAYTPAHTHPETFAYRIEVDEERLVGSLRPNWRKPDGSGKRILAADDSEGIRHLQDELEAGQRWQLVGTQRTDNANHHHLNPLPPAS